MPGAWGVDHVDHDDHELVDHEDHELVDHEGHDDHDDHYFVDHEDHDDHVVYDDDLFESDTYVDAANKVSSAAFSQS